MPLRTILSATLVAASVAVLGQPVAAQTTWRSALYPTNWTPGYTVNGKYLHDFSYAGYQQGLKPIPKYAKVGSTFNVVTQFGADPTGKTDSTSDLQAAIDHVGSIGGGVVYLPPGTFRCDGMLKVDDSGVVIRGNRPDQTTLYFTQWLGMKGKKHLSFKGKPVSGPDLFLSQDGVTLQHHVFVNDASSLKPGDDIDIGWKITSSFVAGHGMTGTWTQFNGQWRAFFRRSVVSVNLSTWPHKVTFDVPLRYPAKKSDGASIRKVTGMLEDCGLEHLSISNAVDWSNAWSQTNVHAVEISGAKNCWIQYVESTTSPSGKGGNYHLQSGGLVVKDSKSITILGCDMRKAQNRGPGGAGYLYEVSRSNEVLVKECVALEGRHNLIQNWDFGTSGLVFLRCTSADSMIFSNSSSSGNPAMSEYHHSLAIACLVDECVIDDGWKAVNNQSQSSGAGHTATQSVFWNTQGAGTIETAQYGMGYVIGTRPTVTVDTEPSSSQATGTSPTDYTEGLGSGVNLKPRSLYEDQLALRAN